MWGLQSWKLAPNFSSNRRGMINSCQNILGGDHERAWGLFAGQHDSIQILIFSSWNTFCGIKRMAISLPKQRLARLHSAGACLPLSVKSYQEKWVNQAAMSICISGLHHLSEAPPLRTPHCLRFSLSRRSSADTFGRFGKDFFFILLQSIVVNLYYWDYRRTFSPSIHHHSMESRFPSTS